MFSMFPFHPDFHIACTVIPYHHVSALNFLIQLQVYLFVSSQRIVGCLVVEPIMKAYKVVSCFLDERPEESKMKDSKPNSTTLQFGNISFRREAILKKPTDNPEALDVNLNGVILCEEEAVPAVCGIRAIWVTPANRRKHIATQLLDAAR